MEGATASGAGGGGDDDDDDGDDNNNGNVSSLADRKQKVMGGPDGHYDDRKRKPRGGRIRHSGWP